MSRAEYAPADRTAARWPVSLRLCMLAAGLVAEGIVLTVSFSSPVAFAGDPWWTQLAAAAPSLARIGAAFLGALLVLLVPRLRATLDRLWQCAADHRWQPWVLLHLLAFAALYYFATVAGLGEDYYARGRVSSSILAVCEGLGIAAGLFWSFALAPLYYWRSFIARERLTLLSAAVVATAAWLGGGIPQAYWKPLTSGTFFLAEQLLRLVYSNVVSDQSQFLLGTPTFVVQIWAPCSGYEGIGLRGRLGDEVSIRLCMIVMGVFVSVVALSRSPVLSGSALVFAGAAWTASVTVFNVGVQLAAPRWVAGRALAAYQAAISGGIALGSWVWGSTASAIGVEGTLLISGATLLLSPLLGLWMRMPTASGPNELSLDVLADPEVRLSLTPRSGPIVIEIEYRVDPAKARLFYAVMQHVQLSRQRNGAYGWSISRDIADPELWTERYHCPTWHDYLRQRSRSTASERALHLRANEFHIGPEPIRIRRMLERPVGSVRWKEDTPDRSTAATTAITSPGTGP